jgi:hypothetical protein
MQSEWQHQSYRSLQEQCYCHLVVGELRKIMFVKEFLVKINYKNGQSESFWVTTFSFEAKGGQREVKYRRSRDAQPLFLNVDEIQSVWQVKYRWKFGKEAK